MISGSHFFLVLLAGFMLSELLDLAMRQIVLPWKVRRAERRAAAEWEALRVKGEESYRNIETTPWPERFQDLWTSVAEAGPFLILENYETKGTYMLADMRSDKWETFSAEENIWIDAQLRSLGFHLGDAEVLNVEELIYRLIDKSEVFDLQDSLAAWFCYIDATDATHLIKL